MLSMTDPDYHKENKYGEVCVCRIYKEVVPSSST